MLFLAPFAFSVCMMVPPLRRHPMTRRLFCISAFLLFAISTFPQTTKSQRAVDLTSADGTKLKATFFAAAQPGPGVLLLHQCNRDRKVWDPLPEQLAAA